MLAVSFLFFMIFYNIIKNNYLNNLKEDLKNNLVLVIEITKRKNLTIMI